MYQFVVAPVDVNFFPGNSQDQHHEVIVIDVSRNQSAVEVLLKQVEQIKQYIKKV